MPSPRPKNFGGWATTIHHALAEAKKLGLIKVCRSHPKKFHIKTLLLKQGRDGKRVLWHGFRVATTLQLLDAASLGLYADKKIWAAARTRNAWLTLTSQATLGKFVAKWQAKKCDSHIIPPCNVYTCTKKGRPFKVTWKNIRRLCVRTRFSKV